MSKWTDDRVDLLKKLWGEGKTAKEIAHILGGGLTRNAVIGKAHRMKLSGRVSPIQQNKTIQQENAENNARSQGKLVDARSNGTKSAKSQPVRSSVNAKHNGAHPPIKRKPVPAAVNEAQGEPTQLENIKDRMCRWPIGDPKHDDFHFCGGEATPGVPYCDVHAEIAYNVNVRSKSITINESKGKNRRDEADEILSSMANAS